MNDTEAAIVLNMLPQVGPVRVRRLTERFGSPSAILTATGSALRGVEGIGPEVSSVITSWKEHADLDAELAMVLEGLLARLMGRYPLSSRFITQTRRVPPMVSLPER